MRQSILNRLWLQVCMLVAVLCVGFTGTARGDEATAYAVVEKNASNTPKAVTFYYDDQKASHVGENISIVDITTGETEARGWRAGNTLTSVTFDESFARYTGLTALESWFAGCDELTTITGLQNVNTSNVTSLFNTFSGCSGLTTLDLSRFKTGRVREMKYLFQDCSNLTTIYVSDGWTTTAVTDDGEQMFQGCTRLVGGAGTEYDSGHQGVSYAHIDGGSSDPGYLTDINTPRPPTAYAVVEKDASENPRAVTFYYDNQKATHTEGTVVDITTGETEARNWRIRNTLTSVTFDESFAQYTGLTALESWFAGCDELTTITGLQNVNTSNVTSLFNTFSGCSGLTTLDLSHFKTGRVREMKYLFQDCSNLTTIYVSDGWTTTAVTDDGEQMFQGCTSLVGGAGTEYDSGHQGVSYAHIDGGSSDPGYLTDINAPLPPAAYAVVSTDGTNVSFYYDGKKAAREGTIYDITDGSEHPWSDNFKSTLTSAAFAPEFKNYTGLTSLRAWFSECQKLESIDGLTNLNTENVEDMMQLFRYCQKLTSIDVSSFKTDKVTNMTEMFGFCTDLTSITMGENFNTSNVVYMSSMFTNCQKLTTIDLSNFNTGKVMNMSGMFWCCYALTDLDLSSFNTERVTNMNSMFGDCRALTTLDLSSFNTASVRNMGYMFYFERSPNLVTIYVGDGWTATQVSASNSTQMFLGCRKIVGGNGTTYDYNHTTAEYARVDGQDGQPGYLTLKSTFLRGDVNGDGQITIADVTALVNIILGKDDELPHQYNHEAAKVNDDDVITIADVTALVNIILGK